METCLLTHYIYNSDIKNTCDFKSDDFEGKDSVYEVIRVINSIPLFLDDHLLRFQKSLEINNSKSLFQINQIKKTIKALIEVNKLSIGNIKIQYNLNTKEYYAWINPFFYPSEEQKDNGVECSLMKAIRINPNSKTTNLELRKQSHNQTLNKNTFEVLLYDNSGEISEGSKSNLFFIKDNTVYTSADSKVLIGISRMKIIELCNKNNIKLLLKSVNINDLNNYDSAFLSGTSLNILPIKSIENISFDTHNESILFLKKEFEKLIIRYLETFKWNL